MISEQQVYKCKYLFYHSGCPDGIAAREIMLYAFPHLIPQPFWFGAKIDGELEDKLKDGAIFIDIHPNMDQIILLMERYFICIADHHKTSSNSLNELYECGYDSRIMIGNNEMAESGAVLAYKIALHALDFSDPSGYIKDFATLIGISDTWHTENPRFQESRNLANWIQVFGNTFTGVPDKTMWKMIESYKKASEIKNKSLAKGAIIREKNGLRVAFINGEFISDASEILRGQGVNVIVGHKVVTVPGKGECLNYSVRSDASYNARILCENFGGGGHDQAAGCSIPYTGQHPIGFILEQI